MPAQNAEPDAHVGSRGAPAAAAQLTPSLDDDDDDLPRGSFGAGGWSAGGKGCYPRFNREEAAQARRVFRRLLLTKYHSMARAWVDMDTNGDGRLSFFEFCRACQRLGIVYNPRQLWDAMDIDKNYFVTLDEVDPKFAELLGQLAMAILTAYTCVEDAWNYCFNRRGSYHVDFKYFSRACTEVGFTGNHRAVFEALRADKATTGICRREFGLLELWFGQEPPEFASPLHTAAEQSQIARAGDHLDMAYRMQEASVQSRKSVVVPQGTLADFKRLLLKSYGNFARAWRQGLDYDRNGRLDYNELQRACKHVGYAGNRRELWNQLDNDMNGTVSLREIDESTADLLEDINRHAVLHYGTWHHAWRAVMDVRDDDRVDKKAFVEGCQMLGFKGPAEHVFDLLDMDRARYLTLAGTTWISGLEEKEPEKEMREFGGDIFLTGKYKGMTRSQARKLEDKERDNRLREARFEMRGRRELQLTGELVKSTHSLMSSSRSMPSLMVQPEPDGIFPTAYVPQRTPLVSPLSSPEASSALRSVGRRRDQAKAKFTIPRMSPSKGGWPAMPMRVTDPVYKSGKRVERIQELVKMLQPPEPNKLLSVSDPHLHKWHSGLSVEMVEGDPALELNSEGCRLK